MSSTKQMEVIVPTGVDRGFDYGWEGDALAPGTLVEVPFGKSNTLGIVWQAGNANIPREKLKPITRTLDRFPAFSDAFREFLRWSAWYNCASLGSILKMALPIKDVEKMGRLALPERPASIPALATLEGKQAEAASTLARQLQTGFQVMVLDGVTGSGKTEVYFDTIARALAANEHAQILILLPEIALSLQVVERFSQRFGFKPILWHSGITPAQRRVAWQAIATGQASVIIGARSALYLPYRHLSLIIVDEEHDSSYKQTEIVLYHARDMAIARARLENIPVILASATPSIETYYNMVQGKYTPLELPARHGGARMPTIELLDLRDTPPERDQFIAPPLRQALADTLSAGNQSLLFLNRRGYAPLVLCRTCGHRFQCAQCSAWLVMHKRRDNSSYLHCHHCDYRTPTPDHCPECQSQDSLHPCGPGVERIHEEVSHFLPQARLGVLTSEASNNPTELQSVLDAMQNGEIDILIGTQIIAKGHHFPNLATVGVVDADLGLSGGELRACEQTYQLLHQIAGRAGRESVEGHVYLQSYFPDHPVMKALQSGQRDPFLKAELAAREMAQMPPYTRLAAIIVDGPQEQIVKQVSLQLARSAPQHEQLQILGPAPAPMSLLRGRYRYRLLIQAPRKLNLPDIMRNWVAAHQHPSTIRIKVDIDPISFL